MAMLDALLDFEGNEAGVAITVSRASTNVLNMAAQRDMGVNPGQPLSILALITETFAAAGLATLQTFIQGSPDNVTYTDYVGTGAIAVANLEAGREVLRTPLPLRQPAAVDGDTPPQYYRLNYTVAIGPMTAGKIAAYLLSGYGRQDNYAYPKNFVAA